VVEKALRMGTLCSAVIAAINLPRIVEKMVEFAKKPGGWRDRELLAKATGLLPCSEGWRSVITDLRDKQQASTQLPPMEAVILSFNERLPDKEKPALPPVPHAKETR